MQLPVGMALVSSVRRGVIRLSAQRVVYLRAMRDRRASGGRLHPRRPHVANRSGGSWRHEHPIVTGGYMLHHSPEVDAELYDEGRPQEGGLDRTVSLIRPTACYYIVMNFEEHRRGHTIRGYTEVERRGKGRGRGEGRGGLRRVEGARSSASRVVVCLFSAPWRAPSAARPSCP